MNQEKFYTTPRGLNELPNDIRQEIYQKYWLSPEDNPNYKLWYDNNTECEQALNNFKKVFNLSIVKNDNQLYTFQEFTKPELNKENISRLKGLVLYNYLLKHYFKKLYIENPLMEYLFINNNSDVDDASKSHSYYYKRKYDETWIENSLFSPIYEYIKQPNLNLTFEDLINECLKIFKQEKDTDLNNFKSFDNFEFICNINKWKFDLNKNLYKTDIE